MAHHKRKKPKLWKIATCPYCMFTGEDGPALMRGHANTNQNTTMGRHRASDWRRPQMYDDEWKHRRKRMPL